MRDACPVIATGPETAIDHGMPGPGPRLQPTRLHHQDDGAGNRRRARPAPTATGNPQLPLRTVPRDLDQLGRMTKVELAREFQTLYGVPPPKYIHRAMLLRAVAHQWQVEAAGGPDRAMERRLVRLAAQLRRHGSVAPERPAVKPGTQLLREWQGETHTVTVTEAGFRYREQAFESLTAIARLITGTAWSGPAFFGLRDKKRT